MTYTSAVRSATAVTEVFAALLARGFLRVLGL
jgi:hypothetical protein